MELTFTHASFALSLTTLGIIIKFSYRLGRHLEQFDEIKARVRLHDKILKLEPLAATAISGE